MKLLLKISFIGTAYSGFQCQKNATAIQNVLTAAAERAFGFPCKVTGCSRTDAGVHATGFCCTVEPVCADVSFAVPAARVHRALAPVLPCDIAVTAAAEVPDDFHPRYSARGKEYIYKIHDGAADDPFSLGRSCRYYRSIDEAALRNMNAAAKRFIGRHDFRSFMASGSRIEETERCVSDAAVYRAPDSLVCFSVAADGFLYNMVRIMAGTLLDVAAGRLAPEDTDAVIGARDRKAAGATAPPEGLYLSRVFYDEKIDWQCE